MEDCRCSVNRLDKDKPGGPAPPLSPLRPVNPGGPTLARPRSPLRPGWPKAEESSQYTVQRMRTWQTLLAINIKKKKFKANKILGQSIDLGCLEFLVGHMSLVLLEVQVGLLTQQVQALICGCWLLFRLSILSVISYRKPS